MLRDVGVGAGDEHAAVGDVRQRVPHLLAVHDPLVAVADRSRREAGEVGARAGLGEELAPDLLTGEHRPQRAAAQFVAAVGHDRRAREREPEEQRAVRRRRAGLAQAPVDVALHRRREAEAAEALREVHPREAEVVLRATELDTGGASSGSCVASRSSMSASTGQVVSHA